MSDFIHKTIPAACNPLCPKVKCFAFISLFFAWWKVQSWSGNRTRFELLLISQSKNHFLRLACHAGGFCFLGFF